MPFNTLAHSQKYPRLHTAQSTQKMGGSNLGVSIQCFDQYVNVFCRFVARHKKARNCVLFCALCLLASNLHKFARLATRHNEYI